MSKHHEHVQEINKRVEEQQKDGGEAFLTALEARKESLVPCAADADATTAMNHRPNVVVQRNIETPFNSGFCTCLWILPQQEQQDAAQKIGIAAVRYFDMKQFWAQTA